MNIILDYHNVCEKNQTYICLLGGPGNPSMHNHKISLTFTFHISLFFSPYSDPHVGKKGAACGQGGNNRRERRENVSIIYIYILLKVEV